MIFKSCSIGSSIFNLSHSGLIGKYGLFVFICSMKIIIISLCIVNKYSLKNKNNLIYKKLWMVQKTQILNL